MDIGKQKFHNLLAVFLQSLNLYIDSLDYINTSTEVFRLDQLLQKQLIHIDTTLVPNLFSGEIEFYSVFSDGVNNLIFLYRTIDKSDSCCLRLSLSWIIEGEFKCPSIIAELIENVPNKFIDFIFGISLCHIKISCKHLTAELGITVLGYSTVI